MRIPRLPSDLFHRAILILAGLTPCLQAVEISTDYPGGNVIVLANESGQVRLKPDLRGGRDWFYWNFEATADQPGTVEFVLRGSCALEFAGRL